MLAWLAAHWLMFAGGGLGVLAFLFPAVSLPVLKFLVTTERGRYLLLAGIVVCSFRLWGAHCRAEGRAAVLAEQAATAARAQLAAQQEAVKRDGQSDTATAAARQSGDARLAEHNQRVSRVEGIAREPRPPVPVVCPDPDPRLVRELGEGTHRLRATEGRLRSLGAAQGRNP